MVFFGTNYEAHINEEFGVTSYFNYEILKTLTHQQEDLDRIPYAEHKKRFGELFEKELSRVDDVFANYFSADEYLMVDCQLLAKGLKVFTGNKAARKAQEASLKRNLTVLYRKLSQLETYRLLNKTLIIKILKKYDKVHKAKNDPVFESLMATVNYYHLGNGAKLQNFHADVETLYATFFCDGLREEAQGKLILAKGDHRPKKMFFLAGKVGIFLTLIAWFFFDVSVSASLAHYYINATDPAVYVYAFVAALIVYRWIWGFNVYMWESVGIDYILLLDLDANKSNIKPSYDQIFSEATTYSILFFINIIIFHAIKIANETVDEEEYSFFAKNAFVMPVLLLLGVLGTTISNCRHISYGVFSLNVFAHCFSAPFTTVTFRHTYAADILTSFTKVVGFAAYSGCYFTSGTYLYAANKKHGYGEERFESCDTHGMHALKTFIYILPLYMRFMQNMRQQYDSVQRQKAAMKASTKVLSIEDDDEKKMEVEKGMDGSSEGEGHFKVDDMQPNSLRLVSVDEEDDVRDHDRDRCSPRAHKENGLRKKGEEKSGNRGPPGYVLSHSESSSSITTNPSTAAFRLVGQPALKGQYSYPTRVKNFIFAYLLIWPYSYNAFKYFLSILVVLFGAYPPQDPESTSYQVCYLSLAVVSTLYSTYWDFRNDWGLFQMKAPKPLLREKIYYGNTEYFYYIVLILNPIFRSFWTLSFTPYGSHPFLACFEIFRRSLWACLRMELGYINELKKRMHMH